jgi:hypothetical protein
MWWRSFQVEIKGLLRNISGREKMFIIAAGALFIIFLIYQFVYIPLMRTRDEYGSEKIELENSYGSYELLAGRYLSARSGYDLYHSQLQEKKSLSVLTYLENEAQGAGIRDNIEYIRPRGAETKQGVTVSSVEMKINAISARDLFLFLGGIEKNRKGLIISYLRLKPFFKEKEEVDVIVRVNDITVN